MSGFSPKTARVIAWIIFISGCLLVSAAIVGVFWDGNAGEFSGAIAKSRAFNFGATAKTVFMTVWNAVADFLTITIDTIFGKFTGVDFKAKGIGHYMLIGLIVLGVIAFIFVLLFFRD